MNRSGKSGFFKYYKHIILFVLLLWAFLFASYIMPLNKLGIAPRKFSGLIGIILSPMLHAGVVHLATNSISLLMLGLIFVGLEKQRWLVIFMLIFFMSGAGTWLIGRSDFIHIGASGVVYGIMGYLISVGIFKRDFKTIFTSLIVFILYGGAIFGVLPSLSFISWESHLSGFVSGIIIAKSYVVRK